MGEIGGYIELEHYHGKMLHEDGLKLNCGRNCLKYLIEARAIKEICLPALICDSVIGACREAGTQIRFYPVKEDFRPVLDHVPHDAWVYVVSYYGQYTPEETAVIQQRFPHMILDLAQAYFDPPAQNCDTLYTCRKFFGVPDGGILYTDAAYTAELPQEPSYMHMAHLLGRFECGGSAYYRQSVENNLRMKTLPVGRMSGLTENLLRSIDYGSVKIRRTKNYAYLAKALSAQNSLSLQDTEGAFAYPFYTEYAAELRKYLQQKQIYIPTLWPNVLETEDPASPAYRLAANVLPLPCDQRYTEKEMAVMADEIISFLKNAH